MGLEEVAKVLVQLVQAGQITDAVTQATAVISTLRITAPMKNEIASTVRARCQEGDFGKCITCGGPITLKRMAATTLTARECDTCCRS